MKVERMEIGLPKEGVPNISVPEGTPETSGQSGWHQPIKVTHFFFSGQINIWTPNNT
jgi:hypothetical protein